jgi:hypothetical protein
VFIDLKPRPPLNKPGNRVYISALGGYEIPARRFHSLFFLSLNILSLLLASEIKNTLLNLELLLHVERNFCLMLEPVPPHR